MKTHPAHHDIKRYIILYELYPEGMNMTSQRSDNTTGKSYPYMWYVLLFCILRFFESWFSKTTTRPPPQLREFGPWVVLVGHNRYAWRNDISNMGLQKLINLWNAKGYLHPSSLRVVIFIIFFVMIKVLLMSFVFAAKSKSLKTTATWI